jgi:hypothetical protein
VSLPRRLPLFLPPVPAGLHLQEERLTVDEVFGHPGVDLGPGERTCAEPEVPGAIYDRLIHMRCEAVTDAPYDARCVACGARFLDETDL